MRTGSVHLDAHKIVPGEMLRVTWNNQVIPSKDKINRGERVKIETGPNEPTRPVPGTIVIGIGTGTKTGTRIATINPVTEIRIPGNGTGLRESRLLKRQLPKKV